MGQDEPEPLSRPGPWESCESSQGWLQHRTAPGPGNLRQPTPAEPRWSRARKSCSEQLQRLHIPGQMPRPSQLFKDASVRVLDVYLGLLSSAPGYKYPCAPLSSCFCSIGISSTSLVLPSHL